MKNTELLKMLQANLEILPDFMDAEAKAAKKAELLQYIEAARQYITTEGIDLEEDSAGDDFLIVMYASWLYSRRKADASYGAMPRMLRYALNNRLFSQHLADKINVPDIEDETKPDDPETDPETETGTGTDDGSEGETSGG